MIQLSIFNFQHFFPFQRVFKISRNCIVGPSPPAFRLVFIIFLVKNFEYNAVLIPTIMKKYIAFFTIIFSFLFIKIEAQTGCPGCVVTIDPNMAADTAFLSEAAIGFIGVGYDSDVSFRLPITTTPVFAIDSTTPPNLPIDGYEITGLTNLPPGLTWEADTTKFETSDRTDGCAKICGIPTQAGQYFVGVQLTASVFGLPNATSFEFPITVYPKPNDDIPFEIFGNNGCGPTMITFFNNIKSDGKPGFKYIWDFGNLTISQEENPDPVTYDSPGIYPVFFRAEVDTAGFILNRITVNSSDCDDFSLPPFVSGNPDLYLQMENAAGEIILTTPIQENADFPASFDVNINLTQEDYRLKVFDDDGILAGDDDLCGEVLINENTQGLLRDSTNLEVAVSVFHPIEVIDFMDTVVIYEAAPIPSISPDDVVVNCKDTLKLTSSIDQNVEWFFEGNSFSNESEIEPDEPGRYWVTFTDPGSGCTASSDTSRVPELVRPPMPTFDNDRNWLTISDTLSLPTDYAIQWFLDGDTLTDEIGLQICALVDGNYSVILTDNLSGCISEFQLPVTVDPNGFQCLSSADELGIETTEITIYPNPSVGFFNIKLENTPIQKLDYQVFNSEGKTVKKGFLSSKEAIMDLTGFVDGIYLLQIIAKDQVFHSKIIKK